MKLIVIFILRIFFPYKLELQLSKEEQEIYLNKNTSSLLKIIGWSLLTLFIISLFSTIIGHALKAFFETFEKNQPEIYFVVNQLLQVVSFILVCKLLLYVLRTKLNEDFDHLVIYLSIENQVDLPKVFRTGYHLIIFVLLVQTVTHFL